MRRVVVTGLGAVTPLGVGVRPTWRRLLAGDSGIVSTACLEPQDKWKSLPSTVAGLVPTAPETAHSLPAATQRVHRQQPWLPRGHDHGDDGDYLWRPSDWLQATDQRRMSKFTQYAVAAAEMALSDAGWKPDDARDREMTGVCLGSGIGNFDDFYSSALDYEQHGYKKLSPLFVPRLLINMAAGHISMRYGFQGPNHAVTTACTTGAHSIGDASRFIAFGDSDVMVAGGAESCIHPLAFAGFCRSRSLSTLYKDDPAASSRPFDRDRDGFVMAEGAAVLVLEALDHARARGANILAELRGYGCSGDAHHMTAPAEGGAGALLAMQRALRNAAIRPSQVDYLNAHATGTAVGDRAEATAIQTLLAGDERADKDAKSRLAVSSTKGAIGHLLGASGAVEAMFCVLAIAEDVVPPTLNLHNPDVDTHLNLVPLQAQEKKVAVAMSNSFGFGGTNASLVFSKYSEPDR